ncbi:hypothetical protein ACP4OV_012442 [Aristida adscensionis]
MDTPPQSSSARGAGGVRFLPEQQQQVQPAAVATTEASLPPSSRPALPPPPAGRRVDEWAWGMAVLNAFERLPPQAKLATTAYLALYGPRSRPRLPVFEAICPSDDQ